MNATTRSPTARVSALRTLSLVLAFTAAVGLIFGTAGFSAMEADRGLAVNVTDDESAYLGYEAVNHTVHDGEPTDIVEYRNQFDSDLGEFDVEVSSDHGRVTVVSAPEALGEGSKSRVTLVIRCDTRTTVPLLFEADGNGGGVSVSLDRTHTVTCVPKGPTVTGVIFDDASNGRVLVDGEDGAVAADVWIVGNPPTEPTGDLSEVEFDGTATFDTATKIRRQVNATPANWKIVAVEFPDRNVTYFHPGWDAGVYETPATADGVAYNGTVDEGLVASASVENGSVVVNGSSGDG
ncbi:hypothetical protein DJ71_12225 [Halorubrum sp. E3]|uniref:Uncharacterized protein n=1 Tax=Halorubrum persicum TaxID=1383844 RepID=A0A2G1WGN7_9EURY|nr:hypothetical protein [Halorubrum persicum]OYR82202.1 hypothetical protein DJ71_12225 [Halorubrum sp. E3]PHQ38167.1 hypothetical protein DJ69_13055 [Halorubrum persicum]